MASTELTKVTKEGKEKMAPLGQYMKNVKEKMGKEWDEKLAPAVKQMYEQAKEKGEMTKMQMAKAWQEKVEPVLQEKFKEKVEADEPVIEEPTEPN